MSLSKDTGFMAWRNGEFYKIELFYIIDILV